MWTRTSSNRPEGWLICSTALSQLLQEKKHLFGFFQEQMQEITELTDVKNKEPAVLTVLTWISDQSTAVYQMYCGWRPNLRFTSLWHHSNIVTTVKIREQHWNVTTSCCMTAGYSPSRRTASVAPGTRTPAPSLVNLRTDTERNIRISQQRVHGDRTAKAELQKSPSYKGFWCADYLLPWQLHRFWKCLQYQKGFFAHFSKWVSPAPPIWRAKKQNL